MTLLNLEWLEHILQYVCPWVGDKLGVRGLAEHNVQARGLSRSSAHGVSVRAS